MVIGLPVFKEHFRGFEDCYVLIGGTACDAWMKKFGLRFRKTKDLDIVLLVEALTPGFVEKLKEFLEDGQYGLPEGSPEWTGIIQALKEITPGETTPSPKVLLETLVSAFHLD